MPEIAMGSMTVHAYEAWGVVTGVLYALLMYPVARRAGIGARDFWVIGVVTCAALYLGSRVFFEALEFGHMPGRMWVDPHPIWLRIWEPVGFTFLGGAAALFPAHLALGLSRAVKPGPGRILDVLAPVTAFAFAASKVGCLLAGCCGAADPRVPLQVIEMAIAIALGVAALAAIFRAPASWRLRDGTVYAAWMLASSVARFATGFARGGYEVRLGPLHAVQWGAAAIAIASVAALAWLVASRREKA